jgi:hypothetical protein
MSEPLEKTCKNCRFFQEHEHRGMSYNDGVCKADGELVAFRNSCIAFKEFIPDFIPPDFFIKPVDQLPRNKTLGQLFRLQNGKCHFCEGDMEKGPYEGKGDLKQVRPSQAVKAHLHSRLSEERKTNPIVVAAHYRCQQQRSRKDVLVDHRQEHLMSSFRGILESAEG